MHSVIENVCKRLEQEGKQLQHLSDESRFSYVQDILSQISDEYSDTILKR